MKARILVTGGSGLLGSALVRQLCSGHDIVATYQTNESNLPFGCGRSVKIDLSEQKLVLQLFGDMKINLVINTAGSSAVDRCETDYDYAFVGNVAIVRNLIAAAQGTGIRIFQISTDYVFDGQDGPASEDATPNPINQYGRSKLAGEQELLGSQLPGSILRVCSLYSLSPSANVNIARNIITTLKAGQTYVAAEDLFSNPTEVNDLSGAIVELVAKPELPKILHLAPREYLSRYEFAQMIARQIGADPTLVRASQVDDLRLAAKRPKRAGLKSESLSIILGRELKGASEMLQGSRAS